MASVKGLKSAPKESKASKEERLEADAKRDEMFAALERELDKELGKAIADKSPVEIRMLADEAQYWGTIGGFDKEDVVAGHDQLTRANRMPTDNKTRSKTRIAASRIGDMLFPTNAPNWDMRPSPYPDVPIPLLVEEYQKQKAAEAAAAPPAPEMPPEAMGGQPPPEAGMGGPPMVTEDMMAMGGGMPPPDMGGMMAMGGGMGEMPPEDPMMGGGMPSMEDLDYEQLAMEVSTKRCRKMRQLIRDALSENDYAKVGRAVIMDGCKLGTGIVKGPYVRYRTQRTYEEIDDGQGPVTVLKMQRVVEPAVARVSPWMFFPQRARCIDECEHTFELHILNRMKLSQMVETHGFFPRQTAKLLSKQPTLGQIETVLAQRAAITNYSMARYENCYAVWEYHGIIDAKVLREMGFEIPEEEDALDNLHNYMGTVWFSEHEVLRIDMAPLEAQDRVPYRVWNYEEDETHVFGFGVPFIMRDDQYVIDMVWTAILHNTSVSAGPQLAVEKGCMTPADGSYSIRSPKLWYKNDVDVPMAQAMEAFIVPNTLGNTMPVYQQAVKNADDNTLLPHMLGTGQAAGQESGASGMVHIAMMNQTNIVQRQAAHNWDDNITDPLITALYQWFMESDDPAHEDAKGDFKVEVRGASHLLVKDTQAQHVQLLMQMAASDPELRMELNMNDVYRLYLNFLDVPVETLVKSPEEAAAEKANQQPDPVQEAEVNLKNAQAQAATARAEADNLRAQAMMIEAQQGQSMDIVDHSEVMALELRYAEMRDKQNDRDLKLQLALIDRETRLMEIASKEGIAYEQMNKQVSSEREQMLADLQVTNSQQASKDYFDAARLRLDQYREELRTKNASKGYDSF